VLAIYRLVDCWGCPFLFNDPAVHWLLSSAALGPIIKFFLFLISFIPWKLRGFDRWWNYDIIYRIPVLSVIYHFVNHWGCHQGCLLLTTQWFTDSWFQPLLGCYQVISSLRPLAFWDVMNNVIHLIVQRIPVLSVIYYLVDHWGCLFPTTQRFTDSWSQPLLGCFVSSSSYRSSGFSSHNNPASDVSCSWIVY